MAQTEAFIPKVGGPHCITASQHLSFYLQAFFFWRIRSSDLFETLDDFLSVIWLPQSQLGLLSRSQFHLSGVCVCIFFIVLTYCRNEVGFQSLADSRWCHHFVSRSEVKKCFWFFTKKMSIYACFSYQICRKICENFKLLGQWT